MTQVSSPCSADVARGSYRPGDVAMWHTEKNGRIRIDATRYDDQISINRVPGRGGQWFKVSVNNQYMYLTRDQIKKLTIHGGSGDDRVRIGPGVPSGIQVFGDKGNDAVVNQGRGAACMHGGPGNDVLVNHGHGAHMYGGPGNDVLIDQSRRPRRGRRRRGRRTGRKRNPFKNFFKKFWGKAKKFGRKVLSLGSLLKEKADTWAIRSRR